MNIKGWIEKRLQEIKSDNVIVLDNWREFYNNKQKDKETNQSECKEKNEVSK